MYWNFVSIELAKKLQIFICEKCIKMHSFTQNTSKIFWGGAKLPNQTSPPLWRGTPLPSGCPLPPRRRTTPPYDFVVVKIYTSPNQIPGYAPDE